MDGKERLHGENLKGMDVSSRCIRKPIFVILRLRCDYMVRHRQIFFLFLFVVALTLRYVTALLHDKTIP